MNVDITDKLTVIELIIVINSDAYNQTPDDGKREEQRKIDLEKIKLERMKAELELTWLRNEIQTISESNVNSSNLYSLVKSVINVTIKIPSKAEGWVSSFNL